MEWGPAVAVCGVILTACGFLWKVRRDEIEDIKDTIRETVSSTAALLKVEVTSLQNEIHSLRGWRHDFGQKEMVYDDYGRRITDLEHRVTNVERGGKSGAD